MEERGEVPTFIALAMEAVILAIHLQAHVVARLDSLDIQRSVSLWVVVIHARCISAPGIDYLANPGCGHPTVA